MPPSPRTPIDSLRAPRTTPRAFIGTRNALTARLPVWPASPAKTRTRSAAAAHVTHVLRPVSRNPPPGSDAAAVCWLAASVPASSSDNANAPTRSPLASRGSHVRFWSSLPNRSNGSLTSELLTTRMTASVALARAISSSASA